jgi:ribulose-phosphate 3-epimerase
MTIRFAPSLLSADFSRLSDEVADIQAAGADMLHLDIMDGHLIAELAAAPVARIAVHVEVCDHLQRTLDGIRGAGIEAGIAINPATALSLLEDALPWADFVLVMSVNPGFGGQEFIPETLDKIRRLRQLAGGQTLDISVDGGVCADNAGSLADAGATTLIAGSAVFGFEDRAAAMSELRRSATDGGTR